MKNMILFVLGKSIKTIVFVSSVIYAFTLVLLLFKEDSTEARNALKAVDPNLGVPIPQLDLASECGVSNIKTALLDVHVFTHFLGWFITTVALRDVAFSWVCGAIWEVVEGTYSNNVPDLKECWWDKVFVDLLGSNNLGIFLGWMFLRYFKLEQYNWAGVSTINGEPLHETGLLYFLPGGKNFHLNQYNTFKSARSTILYLYAHVIIMVLQLNYFFLKSALWVPTVHWIPSIRSFIIASLLVLSGSSIYKKPFDFTGFPLLFNLILALEGTALLKFGGDLLLGQNTTLATPIFMVLSAIGFWFATLTGVRNCCKPLDVAKKVA